MQSAKKLKKFLQKKFKIFIYGLFKLFHGVIKKIDHISNISDANVFKLKLDNDLKYNIYSMKKVRLYTNRIHDLSIIKDNVLIEGPSYQLRNLNPHKEGAMDNASIKENDVLKYGTPRIKKKINGNVLSLLSGGAANHNYFHWLYDVLPRIALCEKINILDKVDFYLLPNIDLKFQIQSLNCLKLSSKKFLNSKKYRHIDCKNLIVTDHPFVINNADLDIHNIPKWIISWLKIKFKEFLTKNKDYPKKIYIDRTDVKNVNSETSREILNEDEVREVLKFNNFSFIQLAKLNFEEQINIFFNAQTIIGLHGSGFANLPFCTPGTKILEFRSINAGKVIQNIAEKSNLSYEALIYAPKDLNVQNQQGKILVKINELKKFLG